MSIMAIPAVKRPVGLDRSPELQAALMILTTRALSRKGCLRYVDPSRREIHFPAMLESARGWSDSERLLVRVAWDLFNGHGEAPLGKILHTLDDEHLAVVMRSIQTLRGQKHESP